MTPRATLRASILLGLALLSASCADLLGLEPGILTSNDPGGAAGAAALAGNAQGDPGGIAGSTSGGSAHAGAMGSGAESGSLTGNAGADLGGAGGAEMLPKAGAPSTGPCTNGTCTECPVGMKQTASKDGFFYCIDAAEVTNADYLAFTERYTVATVIATTACTANDTLIPDSNCSEALTDVPSRNLPVVCVDYCDAEAYCTMHGKRLCGRVGGTRNDPGDNADPAADEWYAACAGPGETVYPYGNSASASKCNSSGYAPADMGPRDLATLSECEGGISGLYNMSGNVAEWEWSCSSNAATATCSTRGGSFVDGPYEVRCSGSISLDRFDAQDTVGFRCCANLKH